MVGSYGGAMAKRSRASDLCSDGRVVRMWVRILATNVLLVIKKDTLLIHYIASLHQGVPVRLQVDIVFEKSSEALQQAQAVYSPGSWESLTLRVADADFMLGCTNVLL